jgi:hypothetical protein
MRIIIIAGDEFWPCHKLAVAVLRRLVARHGPDIVVVHGDDTGEAESFATATKGQRIRTGSEKGVKRRKGSKEESAQELFLPSTDPDPYCVTLTPLSDLYPKTAPDRFV